MSFAARDRPHSKSVWHFSPFSVLLLGTALTSACEPSKPAPSSGRPSASAASKPASAAAPKDVEELLARLDREPGLACEIGYEQTKEAMKNPPAIDAAPFPPFELAPKDVYMADCLRMPRTVQQCVVFAYAFINNAECERARRDYDTQNQRRFAPAAPRAAK